MTAAINLILSAKPHRAASNSCYSEEMDPDAAKLIAEALKHGDLQSSFSPAEIGELIGFSKPRAEAAARWLSNAGVLELGFDLSANFSPDYQKFKSPPVAKPTKAAKSAKTTKRKKKPAAEDDDE